MQGVISDLLAALLSVVRMQGAGVTRSYSELLAALPSVGRCSEGFLELHLKQTLSNDTGF